jgi:hypothetical protein
MVRMGSPVRFRRGAPHPDWPAETLVSSAFSGRLDWPHSGNWPHPLTFCRLRYGPAMTPDHAPSLLRSFCRSCAQYHSLASTIDGPERTAGYPWTRVESSRWSSPDSPPTDVRSPGPGRSEEENERINWANLGANVGSTVPIGPRTTEAGQPATTYHPGTHNPKVR